MKSLIAMGILYLQIFVLAKEEPFNDLTDAVCLVKLGDGASYNHAGKPQTSTSMTGWDFDGYLVETTDEMNFENMS